MSLIQPHDRFLDLGGNSLTWMWMRNLCRMQGLDVRVEDMDESFTIDLLAEALQRRARIDNCDEDQSWSACPPSAVFPLCAAQEGMIFASSSNQRCFLQHHLLSIDEFNLAAFQTAWRKVSALTPALRTFFCWDDVKSSWRQQIALPEDVRFHISVANHLQRSLSASEFAPFLLVEAEGFSIEGAPLMRLRVIQAATTYIIWIYHHLVMDGHAAHRVWAQVMAVYQALRGASCSLHPQFPLQDYITRCSNRCAEASDDVERYWKAIITESPWKGLFG